eukprot:Opistho-2@62053
MSAGTLSSAVGAFESPFASEMVGLRAAGNNLPPSGDFAGSEAVFSAANLFAGDGFATCTPAEAGDVTDVTASSFASSLCDGDAADSEALLIAGDFSPFAPNKSFAVLGVELVSAPTAGSVESAAVEEGNKTVGDVNCAEGDGTAEVVSSPTLRRAGNGDEGEAFSMGTTTLSRGDFRPKPTGRREGAPPLSLRSGRGEVAPFSFDARRWGCGDAGATLPLGDELPSTDSRLRAPPRLAPGDTSGAAGDGDDAVMMDGGRKRATEEGLSALAEDLRAGVVEVEGASADALDVLPSSALLSPSCLIGVVDTASSPVLGTGEGDPLPPALDDGLDPCERSRARSADCASAASGIARELVSFVERDTLVPFSIK